MFTTTSLRFVHKTTLYTLPLYLMMVIITNLYKLAVVSYS